MSAERPFGHLGGSAFGGKLGFMILYIDTTDFNKVVFALSPPLPLGEGRVRVQKKIYKIDPHKSHETLVYLEKFLLCHKIKLEEGNLLPIKKIIVNKGPGSYTGVRVGVTIAQALAFAWSIPIKAVARDKFIIR